MPRAITHGHGTRACYKRGCRRSECVEANRKYAEKRRRAAGVKAVRRVVPAHGTRARYTRGCTCKRCRTANTDYYRTRKRS